MYELIDLINQSVKAEQRYSDGALQQRGPHSATCPHKDALKLEYVLTKVATQAPPHTDKHTHCCTYTVTPAHTWMNTHSPAGTRRPSQGGNGVLTPLCVPLFSNPERFSAAPQFRSSGRGQIKDDLNRQRE